MRAEEVVLRLGRFVETTLPPVSHEVRNRNHDEAVSLTEPGQIGRTRHGAVIVDDFANYPGRVDSGENRKIDSRFGLASTLQDAAGAGAKRKDVSGAPEVLRLAARFSRGPDCLRPVVGRNAGRDATALQIDRDGERRPAKGGVFRRHRAQLQLIEPVARHSDTDQPPTVHSHEVDRLRRDLFRGYRQVAFIFAIFIVDHDDHATCSKLVYSGLYARIRDRIALPRERDERLAIVLVDKLRALMRDKTERVTHSFLFRSKVGKRVLSRLRHTGNLSDNVDSALSQDASLVEDCSKEAGRDRRQALAKLQLAS